MKKIFNWASIIGKDWNEPVNNAQIEAGQHAPVEVHQLPSNIHRDAAMRMFHLLYEELNEYREATQNEEITADEKLILQIDAIFDMQYLLSGLIAQHGLQNYQNKFMHEIHESNLTKLQSGQVRLREDGKILKPDGYRPPDLRGVLEDIKEGVIESL